jgi:hypothetical protein
MPKTRIALLCLALIALYAAGASAQTVTISGQITTWEKVFQGDLPKEKPLTGATVLIGQNLSMTGSGATDVVKGRVVAEVQTDGNGRFSVNVPAGNYSIIVWKAGYVPQTGTVGAPANNYKASISKDTGPGNTGRHGSLRRG